MSKTKSKPIKSEDAGQLSVEQVGEEPAHPEVVAFVPADVYTAESYSAYLEEMDRSAAAEDCAYIKDLFSTATRKDVRVASLNVLKATAHVSMSGAVESGDCTFDEIEPWWVRAGSLAHNFNVEGIPIKAGLCAIVGGGGVGKTPLAHALAGYAPSYAVVRFSEPFAGYTTSQSECASQLAEAVFSQRAVVFDSVKDILAGGGAAMKSGLSRDALVTLSSWSIAAANCGCTIFVPVNPSTSDPETIEILVEALRSNVSAVIYSKGPGSWEYSCRTREGGNRTSGQFSASWARNRIKLSPQRSSGIISRSSDVMIETSELSGERIHRNILSSLQQRR